MTSPDPNVIYCAYHPTVESTLRCNRCEKPICPRCAVLTPTGYRCKDCVRGQQKLFETARWYDYPLAFFVAGLLSYIGSLVVPYTGFFTIFIAPVAGVIIAEAVRYIIRRRRSKRLYQLTGLAVVLGSLVPLFAIIVGLLLGASLAGLLWSLLWQGLYTFTVTSTVYYRLGGIRIR